MKKLVLILIMIIMVFVPVMFWIIEFDFSNASPYNILSGISRLCGLIGFVFALFQFILSMRIKFLERNIGLDRMTGLHRIFGITALIILLSHPMPITLYSLIEFGKIPINLEKILGITTLSIIIITAVLALSYKKLKLKYEIWKNIHRLNYIVVPIAFIHSTLIGTTLYKSAGLKIYWYILITLFGLALIYKIFTMINVRSNPYDITAVEEENSNIYTLKMKGDFLNYIPGQFMFINLVRNGKTSESHPFTISSSPASAFLSITPKELGDFTSTIKKTKIGDKAFVDAPYGNFSYKRAKHKKLVFIAGGIGITPFISMLRYMRDLGTDKDTILFWGNRTKKDIIFNSELSEIAGKIPLKTIHVLSDTSNDPDWEGDTGYIDKDLLLKYLDDFNDKDFFVCGPPIMMNKVITLLKSEGVKTGNIHHEKFSL